MGAYEGLVVVVVGCVVVVVSSGIVVEVMVVVVVVVVMVVVVVDVVVVVVDVVVVVVEVVSVTIALIASSLNEGTISCRSTKECHEASGYPWWYDLSTLELFPPKNIYKSVLSSCDRTSTQKSSEPTTKLRLETSTD